MSQFYDLPVIGVDVAAEFSIATILSPSGDIFKKNFRFIHTLDGFESFLQLIKKTEEEFNRKPQVFCESTGIYHLTLLHFLQNHAHFYTHCLFRNLLLKVQLDSLYII